MMHVSPELLRVVHQERLAQAERHRLVRAVRRSQADRRSLSGLVRGPLVRFVDLLTRSQEERMFAVIGSWPVDDELDPEQLTHIAATVSAQPGFVRGFWGQDPDDAAVADAVVVLEDEQSARAMASGVRSAIPGASLRVIRILAEA